TFLFTWQVTHQAAVKSTKTGRPAARASAIRAGENGSQANAAPAAVESRGGASIGLMPRARSNATATAAPDASRARRPGKRPATQAAKAIRTRLMRIAATAGGPAWKLATHTSQTTVASSGNARSCFSV